MTKRNMVLIGVFAASFWALSVQAQPAGDPGMGHHRPHMMGAGPGRLIPVLLRATDLTPDQDTQVHALLETNRPAVEQIVGQLKQANTDLANLLLGPQDVQADAVAAKQASIAQLQQQLAQQQASTVLAIRALLRPDQLAKADAAKDQMHGWHGDKPCADKTAN